MIIPRIFVSIMILACHTGFGQEPVVVKADGTLLLTREDKAAFIDNASKLLNDNYVFPEVAKQVGEHLKARLAGGAYDTIKTVMNFIPVITEDMQSVSHDKHMRVTMTPPPVVKSAEDNPALESILRQKESAQRNYGFIKVENLKGNVGYIDLRGFVPVAMGRETASAAMKMLSNSDALIFDMRKNGGGSPDLIQYICSYFFDQPTHLNSLYYRNLDRTVDYWTLRETDGKKMSDVPLYILTSNYTFSGGEEFCYNLQTRKRAILIGEVTGGGANPGDIFPVYKNLAMFIPTGRAINPVTGTNWEGVGVKPDIEVPSSKAYDLAVEKATADAAKYREKKRDALVAAFKNSELEIKEAVKLFDQKKNEEGEKMLFTALNEAENQGFMNESSINDLGYKYLGKDKLSMAIAVFRFNVKSHPGSGNAYDSLGETYLKDGNKKLAKENYTKSLELDPSNDNARKILKNL